MPLALSKNLNAKDEEIKVNNKIAINILKNFCLENFIKNETTQLETSKISF
jgi:hypothetical protein